MTTESIKNKAVLDVEDIQKLLPHRPPILMLEKLKDMVGDESAIGIKAVSINEPYFEGHFPNKRVMPGVLIVEAMAQTAGALVLHSLDAQEGAMVYFMSIENARFRRPVVPGDSMEIHVKKIQSRKTVWKYDCKAYVDGKVHAEAMITAMMIIDQ